jgi:hypothetical protein
VVWDASRLPDGVGLERTEAGFVRLRGGVWDGRTFDDVDSLLAFIESVEAGRAASGSSTERSPFGLDVVYTIRGVSGGSSNVDVQSDTPRNIGNDDDGRGAPTLYPAQTCAVCEDAATWAHALSRHTPLPAERSGRNELSLWAMCDRCEHLFSDQNLDALADLYAVVFDIGHLPDLVKDFRLSLAQAQRRTTSVHRIVR